MAMPAQPMFSCCRMAALSDSSSLTRSSRAIPRLSGLLLALTAATATPSAWAQSEALKRCPSIADATARLACYDAVMPPVAVNAAAPKATTVTPTAPAAAPVVATATTTTSTATAATAAGAAATTAPVLAAAPTPTRPSAPAAASAATSVPAPAPAPAPAPVVVTATPPAPAPAPDRFGLPERARNEPASIDSSVSADFVGWDPNTRIRLSNGQVWQVIDGSSGTLAPGQRKVTVTRGALGSFFLEFEGLNKSPRVRRVE